MRVAPFNTSQFPPWILQQIGDIDAAVSADRYATAIALSQDDDSRDHTLYLGLSDVVGARVGRWVFAMPATDVDPARIWWHATWRTKTHYAQLVAWAPQTALPAFLPAMRDMETHLTTTDGYVVPATLLAERSGACQGPAGLDRMATIASSGVYIDARARLTSGSWTDLGRAEAEIQSLGVLIAATEDCVRSAATKAHACEVWERVSDTDRSRALTTGVQACLADDKASRKALDRALTPR